MSLQMTRDQISFIGKVLPCDERNQIIMLGLNHPREIEIINKEFSTSTFEPHNRCINESWYSFKIGKEYFEETWLSHSRTKAAVFCHLCIFFGSKNKKINFRQSGLRDWKKAQEKLTTHEKSQGHVESAKPAIDFANYTQKNKGAT